MMSISEKKPENGGTATTDVRSQKHEEPLRTKPDGMSWSRWYLAIADEPEEQAIIHKYGKSNEELLKEYPDLLKPTQNTTP